MIKLLSLFSAAACLLAQDAQAPAAQPEGHHRPNGLYATFHTAVGDITARLFEKETPRTVENFVSLAQGVKPWKDPITPTMVRRPLYNNMTFHRIMKGVMIQAGDPTGTGSHDCRVKVADEYLPGLRFDGPGKLAMANKGGPDSGGCQFFLTEAPVSEWTGKYTIFGEVVEGRDLISKISHMPAHGDKPIDPVKLMSVSIERFGPEPKAKKPKN